MITVTEKNFYSTLLANKVINAGSVPGSVSKSVMFQQLIGAQAILKERSGRGFKFILNEDKLEAFNFLTKYSNLSGNEIESKGQSILAYGNSKAIKIQLPQLFFLRSELKVKIKDETINLNYFTSNFGAFTTDKLSMSNVNICIVENKELFLKSDSLGKLDFIFIHKYGRWSKSDFLNLTPNKILVMGDYDYTGLNEYLKIKSIFPQADFYIPDNFVELFRKYAKNSNSISNQICPHLVSSSNDEKVVFIRDLIQKENKFLEQEILLVQND